MIVTKEITVIIVEAKNDEGYLMEGLFQIVTAFVQSCPKLAGHDNGLAKISAELLAELTTNKKIGLKNNRNKTTPKISKSNKPSFCFFIISQSPSV